MRITSTPDLLIIENRPWILGTFLGILIFGALAHGVLRLLDGDWISPVFSLAGAAFLTAFIWAFVRRNQLILNASDGTVTHNRRTLFGHTRARYDLADLSRASVQSSTTDKGGNVYRMVLHVTGGMDEGVHPFVSAYVSGKGSHRARDAVNDWLESART